MTNVDGVQMFVVARTLHEYLNHHRYTPIQTQQATFQMLFLPDDNNNNNNNNIIITFIQYPK